MLDGVVSFVARRRRCSVEEAEEFASSVRLHLIDDDYRVLARYEGRSSLRTYLAVVLDRHLVDLRRSRWGVWKPSAEARRAGWEAVRLDELLHRDGLRLDEAIETLRTNEGVALSERELRELAARLPARRRYREEWGTVTVEPMEPATVVEGPALAYRREKRRSDLRHCLQAAMGALSEEDVLILRLRFRSGLTAGRIGQSLGLPAKPLYRRIDRLLLELRGALRRHGFDAAEAAELTEPCVGEEECVPW